MAPLTGLTGLYGPGPQGPDKSNGHLESQGGPVGPGFGQNDPQVPYAYWAGPPPNTQQKWAPELASPDGLVYPGIEGTASLIDRTPAEVVGSHAAPYPRMETFGQLRNSAEQVSEQEARRVLHGQDLGGPAKVQTDPNGNVQPEPWAEGYYTSDGESLLVQVPDQIKSDPNGGSGNAKNRIESSQGFGQLGGYGSGDAHIQRRTAVGPVPGNNQWLNSSERPLLTPRRGYQTTFDGPDSPYGNLGDTSQDMVQGTHRTAVMSDPTPYNDPPSPAMSPTDTGALEAPMISSFF